MASEWSGPLGGRIRRATAERFGRVTGQGRGTSYRLATWVFLRALGLVYLIAFASLASQVQGLYGPTGILPAGDFLARVGTVLGPERYWYVPTVFWLGAGSSALAMVCGLGWLAAVLLVLDVFPLASLGVLWALYLSLVTVGQDFLAFQWDVLLLEAGLLAIVLTSRRGRGPGRAEPHPLPLFLVWWLLVRLQVESGLVKLTSGDPTWRHLTALDFHFFTQPIPTWSAWYANLAPEWIKHLSVAAILLLEILAPLLLFAGSRGRRLAFLGAMAAQTGIALTGNFAFFNLLTVALALPLLDDSVWRQVLPGRLLARLRSDDVVGRQAGLARLAVGIALLACSTVSFIATIMPGGARMAPLGWIEQFHSVNGYGLFRVMTTERPEIAVEGSADGVTWTEYRFADKPGDPLRRPRFVEPHQPRLDWQMWFAALGRFETEAWFQAFLLRLLQGSSEVTKLLEENPFPADPPKYVRARLYGYRFTTREERRRTGAWWTRRLIGEYAPPLSLK